jgi:hypothetical protein
MLKSLLIIGISNMKIKIIGIKMLAQCPICMAIKMNTGDKKRPIHWRDSIAVFEHLPKEVCCRCKK